MRKSRKKSFEKVQRRQPAARAPTVFTLLAHIVAAAFTGGMLLALAFGGALATFLYYNHFSLDNLLVLLFGTVMVMAFYRGCQAWQQDLNAYHSRMSDIRHMAEFKNGERN